MNKPNKPETATKRPPAPTKVTNDLLDMWATDPQGPVALHLNQRLLPVETGRCVVFPPTYADIGYNIDTQSDGTKVVTIDSVGSQANRIEPIFKASSDNNILLSNLVPQVEILLQEKGPDGHVEKRSLLDLAHRSADGVVQLAPSLWREVANAFAVLKRTGDAGPLCLLAPTSLVFGVWDSRGETHEKRPRLVRAIIRAWDVDVLHAAAQFTSISKALTEEQRATLTVAAGASKKKDSSNSANAGAKDAKADAPKNDRKGRPKNDLSPWGLADAPAIFRKVGQNAGKYVHEFLNGSPNPERRVLGGVVVRDRIERDVTVNLVALRGLRGKNAEETTRIRKYVLALSLLAATADIDLFLREGCHLRYADEDAWHQVPRRGEPQLVDLASARARMLVERYATEATKHFKPKWPKNLLHKLELGEAKRLFAGKKDYQQADGG